MVPSQPVPLETAEFSCPDKMDKVQKHSIINIKNFKLKF